MAGVLTALVSSCAGPKTVELKTAVEVLSEPPKAEVRYRGKSLGATPRTLNVRSYEELGAIGAFSPGLEVIEKRIRILSPDRFQLVFKLGRGMVSPLARQLGLTRILIFEYSETVSFSTSSFDLKPEAFPVLEKQAEILNAYFPKATVHVCGFTDSTGGDELNDKLSYQRADAVASLLVTNKVDRSRFKVQGFGKQFEIAPNATPEGRAQNRRTEVILPQ